MNLTKGSSDRNVGVKRSGIRIKLSGNPEKDWLTVRAFLQNCNDKYWESVGEEAKYIRLLNRGNFFREQLGKLWRENGNYYGAGDLIKKALEREYFEPPRTNFRGVVIMTIHKSKGKEFDDVIIVEGVMRNRIVWLNANKSQQTNKIYPLRVGVTRAKRKAVILTSQSQPCPLIP